jgi:hypothetical protein
MAKIVPGDRLQQQTEQKRAEIGEQNCGPDPQTDAGSALFSRPANGFHGGEESLIEPAECVTQTLSSLPQKCLVVHEVAARYGNIEHLVIREDGAVFLIETRLHRGFITHRKGELLVDGSPFEADFIRQTTTNAFVLRDLLADGLGISPFIHAAIVFPNASVGVEKAIYGVDVIEGDQLGSWMGKARGNQEIAGLVAATWSLGN